MYSLIKSKTPNPVRNQPKSGTTILLYQNMTLNLTHAAGVLNAETTIIQLALE